MLIDTHCHLDGKYCPGGADPVLARAQAAGVGGFVVIGVGKTLEPARQAIAIARRRADCWAVVGFHPHDAAALDPAKLQELEELCADAAVVAVGEIGLDYHYMRSPREVQLEAFRVQLRLARRLQKPVVIHTREAAADTLAVLTEERADEVGGILHCFSEDQAFAERALALDFDLSFSGIVTYPSARQVQQVAAWAPLERILVETDSPYLAPVPHRGKRCEPAFVAYTAAHIAELRGLPPEVFAAATTANARRRLRLPAAS